MTKSEIQIRLSEQGLEQYEQELVLSYLIVLEEGGVIVLSAILDGLLIGWALGD